MFEKGLRKYREVGYICALFDYPDPAEVGREMSRAVKGNPRTRLPRLLEILDEYTAEGQAVHDRALSHMKALSMEICRGQRILEENCSLDIDRDLDVIIGLIDEVTRVRIDESVHTGEDLKELEKQYSHLNFLRDVVEKWPGEIRTSILSELSRKLEGLQHESGADKPEGELTRRSLALLLLSFRQTGLLDGSLTNVSMARIMEAAGYSVEKSEQELSTVNGLAGDERSAAVRKLKELLSRVTRYLDEIA